MKSTRILENRALAERIYLLTLQIDEDLMNKLSPGHFVKIKLPDQRLDPLFPRPYTIHSLIGGHLQVLYQIVGKGTRALSQLTAGTDLEILVPLGRPFPRDLGYPLALVAGGVGVAGFGFLLESLPQEERKETILYYGASSKESLVRLDYWETFGVTLKLATEDGSAGYKGFVTDLLQSDLSERKFKSILACGPMPMLKRIKEIAANSTIKTYLSMESFMACGTGFCKGCVVPRKGGGYFHICEDGPTFLADDIIL
ncbi:MAG: dihydroorotate dehydrogenase electron transfer subunit [Caldimicrobium sp.]|nr:dihydroorotate dehydrogenase electron transfer subunit [Caldimicrobium sp.]